MRNWEGVLYICLRFHLTPYWVGIAGVCYTSAQVSTLLSFVSTTWRTLATHLPSRLSEWLVPTLWSLTLIFLAVTSAVYIRTLRLTHALSCAWTTSVLCRWLAGDNQRIPIPYFIWSTSSIHFSFSFLILYLYYTITKGKCQAFIIALIRRSGKESNPTQLMNTTQYSF